MDKINLREKFEKFDDYWSPRIVGELNGQYVKIAKVKGQFVWHDHANEDELFMVIKGKLTIEFRDKTLELNEGEISIVPKGIEHKPYAQEECHILLFEPRAIAHTGEVDSQLTQKEDKWI